VCQREAIRLRGDHNVQNTLAACAITGAASIPVEAMRAAIADFTGVEHRLETVAVRDGVTWVNDSIATAPERVIAALRSYEVPLVLLAGGRDKHLPWDEMAALAVTKCRAVIAFGEYGPQVVEHIRRAKAQNPGARLEQVIRVDDLPQAVSEAQRVAQPGDGVLLSPGGTSFDVYQDFAARGQHFRDLVRALQ
jgi:UDP-N-acetylmuramoylalanine--D-glutamate ligase